MHMNSYKQMSSLFPPIVPALAVSFLCGSGLLLTTQGAENAVILESFEQSIDTATLGDWGAGSGRIPDNVSFSQYTKTGDDDINVTQGSKSLRVDLSGYEWWTLDFIITLSDEASAKVHEALQNTNDVARYILRYDIIFPGGTAWMNNQAFFGNVNDQLNTPSGANGGKATMSWSVDLATGIPDEGPITLRFSDNFDANDEDPFVGPKSVYVDNLRLVDTYAPGATPVTTVLQGFEDTANPTGGAADFSGDSRTTYSQYTKTGPEDRKVTEGTKSLKVHYTGTGDWKQDFTMPFANTKLAEILKLNLPAEQRPTAAELERYTLRYDVIYPERIPANGDGSMHPAWAVTQAFAQDGSWYPYAQARRDSPDEKVQTISITLDQLPAWSDTLEGAPVMAFIAQGDFPSDPFTDGFDIYYDNFRIIDTAATGSSTQPHIDTIKVVQGKVVITWSGGGVLQSSPSITSTSWTAVTGATSGSPIDPPVGGVAFYRVSVP
jgi:hypothetical protein